MNLHLRKQTLAMVAAVVAAIVPNVTLAQEAGTQQAIQLATRSLLDAVSKMESAAGDIQSGEISGQTIDSQKDALGSLDQLIKMADQLPQTGGKSSPQPRPDEPKQPGQQEPNQPKAPQDQSATGNKRRKDKEPQNATSGVAAANTSAAAKTERRRVLVQEVWGHLPPDLKRRLMSVSDEKPLPKYQRSVERYFRALAERSRKPSPSRRESGSNVRPQK